MASTIDFDWVVGPCSFGQTCYWAVAVAIAIAASAVGQTCRAFTAATAAVARISFVAFAVVAVGA